MAKKCVLISLLSTSDRGAIKWAHLLPPNGIPTSTSNHGPDPSDRFCPDAASDRILVLEVLAQEGHVQRQVVGPGDGPDRVRGSDVLSSASALVHHQEAFRTVPDGKEKSTHERALD